MTANFIDLHAAADFLGPGAVEVNRYQSEITDIVRRRGVFGQRIRQVPATGHPSRFFEQTAIVSPAAAQAFVDPRNIVATVGSPTRVERSVPLKALVSQINYNLFDIEIGAQQSQFAFLQAKDLSDSVEGLMRTHDVALWNGNDTSLSTPTTSQYYGASGQIADGGNVATIGTSESIVDNLKETVALMVASSSYEVRPTAIYANPVLLDLLDREMKQDFNVVLSAAEITGGLRVKMLSTQAGDLPLIPEWALSYTGTPGSGTAVLPAYIVSALTLSAPSLGAGCNAVVREVEFEAADLAGGRGRYRLVFANEAAEPLGFAFEPALDMPLDEATPVAQVGTTFLADLADAEVTDITSSTVTIDAGLTPVAGGGIEVRRADFGWGPDNDRELVGRFTTRIFTLTRLTRRVDFFLRQYDASSPRKYSRYSAALRVDWPYV